MSNRTKFKSASRRVQSRRHKETFWGRVWKVISWPFRMIGRGLRYLWDWICGINLIGLANAALLVAIIVLFSMLIMDLINCRRNRVVIVPEAVPVTQVSVTDASAPQRIRERTVVLPLETDVETRVATTQSVDTVPVKRADVDMARAQTARHNGKFWGDVIIDSRAAGAMLHTGATVNGNLYVQDMRKYVLPCGIRINGNLFLRDVNMLQFCGDFVVTGNIYVSPRSSFGPIPKTARVGGHVIL